MKKNNSLVYNNYNNLNNYYQDNNNINYNRININPNENNNFNNFDINYNNIDFNNWKKEINKKNKIKGVVNLNIKNNNNQNIKKINNNIITKKKNINYSSGNIFENNYNDFYNKNYNNNNNYNYNQNYNKRNNKSNNNFLHNNFRNLSNNDYYNNINFNGLYNNNQNYLIRNNFPNNFNNNNINKNNSFKKNNFNNHIPQNKITNSVLPINNNINLPPLNIRHSKINSYNDPSINYNFYNDNNFNYNDNNINNNNSMSMRTNINNISSFLYKPHTIKEYKALTPIHMGPLGPNIGTKDWLERKKKNDRKNKYSNMLSANHIGLSKIKKENPKEQRENEIKKKNSKSARYKTYEYGKRIKDIYYFPYEEKLFKGNFYNNNGIYNNDQIRKYLQYNSSYINEIDDDNNLEIFENNEDEINSLMKQREQYLKRVLDIKKTLF